MHNVESGRRMEEVADLLEAQQANPFRVQAYRRARRVCAVCQSPWPRSGTRRVIKACAP